MLLICMCGEQLLLSIVAPLSGMSSSSEPPIREYTRSQVEEIETEESSSENDLPDGKTESLWHRRN